MATIDDMPAHVLERIIYLATMERWHRLSPAVALEFGLTSKRWAEVSRRIAWRSATFSLDTGGLTTFLKFGRASTISPSRLQHLRSLSLGQYIPRDAPTWLYGAIEGLLMLVGQFAAGLQSLHIHEAGRLSPLVAEAIAKRSLCSLGLSSGTISDGGRLLRAILDGPSRTHLRKINALSYRGNDFQNTDIVRRHSLSALRELWLDLDDQLDPASAADLHLPSLETLHAGAQVIEALIKWTKIGPQITDLSIYDQPDRLHSFDRLQKLWISCDKVLDRDFFHTLPRTIKKLELYCPDSTEGLRPWLEQSYGSRLQLEEIWCLGKLGAAGTGEVLVRRPRWLKEVCEDNGIKLEWYITGPKGFESGSDDDD